MSIFNALADPTRRSLLATLRDGEQAAGVMAESLALPQPSVSKHLRILRVAGLVTVRTDGPRRLYTLDPRPLAQLDQWLAPYRALWSGKPGAPSTPLE